MGFSQLKPPLSFFDTSPPVDKKKATFTERKNRKRLDRRRRDRDYNEVARAKHFPTVLNKNFVPIYNRKAAKIDVENKLKGVRKVNSKLV